MPRQERLAPAVRAVIALGANLGDRQATLSSALAELDETDGIRVDACSPLYETPALTPHGVDETEPAYLNAVSIVTTTLGAYALLDALHRIEDRHGRVRAERWAARTLDLDLIDIGGLELDDPILTLPHPRAHERAFVLVPWLDVDPNASLVGKGRAAELLTGLDEELAPYAAAPPLPREVSR